MKTKELIESRLARMRTVMATSKSARALNTERTYVTHMRQFLWFCAYCPAVKTASAEDLARLYVESKARDWAVATVNQFRNALVFYYRYVVEKPLGELGPWAEAKRPKRLPVWLPDADMRALLACMKGQTRLMAELDYGSGLRSHELASLRWKDIDFTNQQIIVRQGKGAKDRVTFLPQACLSALIEQRERMRALWEMDRRNSRPGVEVPSTKFNGEDWAWFWVWAAPSESTDPRSRIVRRHHVHRSTLGKAISKAVRIWGKDQRVTVHSLRHSFATEMLMDGMPIHELKELMGHAHITTTEIYAHCLPRLTARRGSPMDRTSTTSNVLPFPVATNHPPMRRAVGQ
jgi:site-specific recombinase XerD